MKRVEDWPERLNAYFEDTFPTPFDWGAANCGLFAFGAIEVQTGQTLAPDWLLKAKTEQRIYAEMRRRFDGGVLESARAVFVDKFDMIEISPLSAGRGSIVYLDESGGALGVVDLSGAYILAKSPTGNVRVPLAKGVLAWGFD